MHEVLVNRLGSLSLPRKSVVRLTDRPGMTLDVYRGPKTTTQQQPQKQLSGQVQVDESLLNMTSHGPIHLIPLYRNDNVISKG